MDDKQYRDLSSEISGVRSDLPGFGLYAMTFFAMIGTCNGAVDNQKLKNQLEPIQAQLRETKETVARLERSLRNVEAPEPSHRKLITENVGWGPELESFYIEKDKWGNEVRAYVKIDGKPVTLYFNK